MKTKGKRIALIVAAIFLLICDCMWLLACLFAVGQLYDTYDLKVYLGEAPVAVVILVGLFAAAVICVIRAITLKDKSKDEKDKGDADGDDKHIVSNEKTDKDKDSDEVQKRQIRE